MKQSSGTRNTSCCISRLSAAVRSSMHQAASCWRHLFCLIVYRLAQRIVGSPQLIYHDHGAHTELCRLWPRWMWRPPSTACSSTSQPTSLWSSSWLAWRACVRRQSCLCAMQSTRTCTGESIHCCIAVDWLHIANDYVNIAVDTSADCTFHILRQL